MSRKVGLDSAAQVNINLEKKTEVGKQGTWI